MQIKNIKLWKFLEQFISFFETPAVRFARCQLQLKTGQFFVCLTTENTAPIIGESGSVNIHQCVCSKVTLLIIILFEKVVCSFVIRKCNWFPLAAEVA